MLVILFSDFCISREKITLKTRSIFSVAFGESKWESETFRNMIMISL